MRLHNDTDILRNHSIDNTPNIIPDKSLFKYYLYYKFEFY